MKFLGEFWNGVDELERTVLKMFNAAFDVSDVDGGIVGDDLAMIAEALGCMVSVAFTGQLSIQLDDALANVLNLEDFL